MGQTLWSKHTYFDDILLGVQSHDSDKSVCICVCQQKPRVNISTFRQLLSSVLIDAYGIDTCNSQ